MNTNQNPLFHAKAHLIVIGYEIADCNDEGTSDFDEAVRIAFERGFIPAEMLNDGTAMLELRNRFNDEFSAE